MLLDSRQLTRIPTHNVCVYVIKMPLPHINMAFTLLLLLQPNKTAYHYAGAWGVARILKRGAKCNGYLHTHIFELEATPIN